MSTNPGGLARGTKGLEETCFNREIRKTESGTSDGPDSSVAEKMGLDQWDGYHVLEGWKLRWLKPYELSNGVIPVAALERELWTYSTQGRHDIDTEKGRLTVSRVEGSLGRATKWTALEKQSTMVSYDYIILGWR